MKKAESVSSGTTKSSGSKSSKSPPFDPSISSKDDHIDFNEEEDEEEEEEVQSSDSDSEFERSSQAEDMEDYRLDGYHPVTLGESFKSGQYKVVQKLGWGHFSTVWLIYDTKTEGHYALKIQKSKKSYLEAAQDELEILQALNNPSNIESWKNALLVMDKEFEEKSLKAPLIKEIFERSENYCVKLVDWFFHFGMHGKHQCTVFEIMGPNLLDLIQHFEFKNKFMDLKIVKAVARQVLLGLDYMHRVCGVIHTDLKPENVMLQLEPGSFDYFIAKMKEYKRKPKSMLFLKTLRQKLGNVKASKNRKKQEKKKQKKQAKKLLAESKDPLAEATVSTVKKPGDLAILSKMNTDGTLKTSSDAIGEKIEKQGPTQFEEGMNVVVVDKRDDEEPVQKKEEIENPKKTEKKSKSKSESEKNKEDEPYDMGTLKWKETIRLKIDESIKIKIVDFGNGCWTQKHFTDNIQTREYRSPEAILGIDYNANTDLWSFACMVFEMITNTFLFKPRSGESYGKNDDHLALMMETLGKMPKTFALSGKYSRDYFNKNGQLLRIKDIKEFSIKNILVKDFHFDEKVATGIEEFLKPMLEYDPKKRVDAKTALMHPWLWD